MVDCTSGLLSKRADQGSGLITLARSMVGGQPSEEKVMQKARRQQRDDHVGQGECHLAALNKA